MLELSEEPGLVPRPLHERADAVEPSCEMSDRFQLEPSQVTSVEFYFNNNTDTSNYYFVFGWILSKTNSCESNYFRQQKLTYKINKFQFILNV